MENQLSYLETLLEKNRSYRGYDNKYIVSEKELLSIIDVNKKVPSAKNQQVLRYKIVTSSDADKILKNIKLGGALPELNLPKAGEEPNAFIICCTSVAENNLVYIDLGIACQSMLLKAVELGLNGICIGAFNSEKIINEFSLPCKPLLILAIGKGTEKIEMLNIKANEKRNYFRKDEVHYVPKVETSEIIL